MQSVARHVNRLIPSPYGPRRRSMRRKPTVARASTGSWRAGRRWIQRQPPSILFQNGGFGRNRTVLSHKTTPDRTHCIHTCRFCPYSPRCILMDMDNTGNHGQSCKCGRPEGGLRSAIRRMQFSVHDHRAYNAYVPPSYDRDAACLIIKIVTAGRVTTFLQGNPVGPWGIMGDRWDHWVHGVWCNHLQRSVTTNSLRSRAPSV